MLLALVNHQSATSTAGAKALLSADVDVETGLAAVRDLMLARHPEVKWALEFRTHAGEDAFVLKLSEGAEVELPFGSVTRANLKEDIYK